MLQEAVLRGSVAVFIAEEKLMGLSPSNDAWDVGVRKTKGGGVWTDGVEAAGIGSTKQEQVTNCMACSWLV